MKLFGNRRGSSHEKPGHIRKNTEKMPDGREIELSEIHSAPADRAETPEKLPFWHAIWKNRKLRRALIIIGAVILVLLAVVVAYAIWEQPPDIAVSTTPPAASETPDAAQQSAAADADEEPTDEEADDADAPAVALSTEARRDGVYTVLLVGVDYASSSTDTIMVVSFDTVNHSISCTSIPRDTLINISWANTPKKINAVYPGYINSGKSGIDGLKEHVKNLLGFEVDSYAVVYLQAVEDVVDAIGGVWYDVPQDMYYSDPAQDLYINISAGYQLLSGSDALKLCRFRNGYAGGDLQRISVQQDFLMAAASQILSLGNISNLNSLISAMLENVETDLSAANIAWFARQFLKCSSEDVTFQTMPYDSSSTINGVSFVSIDIDAWLEMVNDSINPYEEDVTSAHVNILTWNGSTVSSTTGTVAGGVDSFYCMSCTSATGRVVYHAPGAHTVGSTSGTSSTSSSGSTASSDSTDSAAEETEETAESEGESGAETSAETEIAVQTETEAAAADAAVDTGDEADAA
ncbi:MAG: LCP family protein [Oscillospiraceae bacterium]|nr:LCP family protein [Oscillospiraceae bacterium]